MNKPAIVIPAKALEKGAMQREIVDADWKAQEKAEEVRRQVDRVNDIQEAMPEHQALVKAQETVETARETFKRACLSNGELNNALEALAEARREHGFRKEHLSGVLLKYTTEFRVRSVEVEGENHLIDIKAKIGKKLKEQTELAL